MERQVAKSRRDRHEPSERLDSLARQVIGAAIAVHRQLGPGFLESVYENALCVELTRANISFVRQARVCVEYEGVEVGDCRLDLLVDDELVVELKAVEEIAPMHKAQTLAYLRATNRHLGVLINFNVLVLKDGVHRIINNQYSAPLAD